MSQLLNVSMVLYHPNMNQVNRLLDTLHQSPVVNEIISVDNTTDNVGYGAGHNKALRQTIAANVPYHLITNTDIEFEPAILQTMVDYMEAHPEVGMLSPKVYYPNGEVQHLCKLLPAPMDLIGRRFLPASWTAKRNAYFELQHTGYDHIMNVPYLSGCFMMVRTDALKKVGLFDERFFMYPEDIDLTRRMHRDYKTLFFPEVSVIHNHERASYRSKRLLWIHITNMCRYFNKWGWFTDSERRQVNAQTLAECGK